MPLHQSNGRRPGSDIDTEGYELPIDIGSTHFLAFNKFASARPHLLLLTEDGYERQYTALGEHDMTAVHKVLSCLNGTGPRRYTAIYNCGIDGGCSRLHKHMQVFPVSDESRKGERFPIWPDAVTTAESSSVPFHFFMHRFEKGFPPTSTLLHVYRQLLGQAEKVWLEHEKGLERPEGHAIPHNVIIDRNWMVVIPRRKAGWRGADANAAGMLGMVWVKSEETMRLWTENGPAHVLSEVGIPC